MLRTLPILLGLALILAAGVAHGLWTHRWVASDEPAASAAKLANIAKTLGDWEGHDTALDPQQQRLAQVAGSLVRYYRHCRTGHEVSVLLVCGLPGPISVHPPDVCYGGAGFALAAPPEKYVVRSTTGGELGEFKTASFGKQEQAVPEFLRIFWAWSADGTWAAPDDARLVFASYPALYKLYVIRKLPKDDGLVNDDHALELLRLLLPELRKALFAPAPDKGKE
jgi:hypothetical protein